MCEEQSFSYYRVIEMSVPFTGFVANYFYPFINVCMMTSLKYPILIPVG